MTSAANGKPDSIFPFLMPFLSKLNVDTMADSEKFLGRWFSSLAEGHTAIKNKRSISTESSDIVIQTTLECIFYLVNKCDVSQSYKSTLIQDTLVPLVIDERLSDGVTDCLGEYLLFWDRNSASSADVAKYNQLFWSSVQYSCIQE